jgi:cation diffusion facilitator CzcD-associated flavoprotein CzcO
MHEVIVDVGSDIGHVWSSRWDSLRLFTPARYASLPGMSFAAGPGTYPAKYDVAGYLAAYVERFALLVQLNSRSPHSSAPTADSRYGREQGGLRSTTHANDLANRSCPSGGPALPAPRRSGYEWTLTCALGF